MSGDSVRPSLSRPRVSEPTPSKTCGALTACERRAHGRPVVATIAPTSRDCGRPEPVEGGGDEQVVVRFADGRTIKGTTSDFVPTKDSFHVSEATADAGAKPLEIHVTELKALFFVKDLTGDPQHAERNEFDPVHPPVAPHQSRVCRRRSARGHDPGLPAQPARLLRRAGRRRVEHRALLCGGGRSAEGHVDLAKPPESLVSYTLWDKMIDCTQSQHKLPTT